MFSVVKVDGAFCVRDQVPLILEAGNAAWKVGAA
jgi:hypothetical protein